MVNDDGRQTDASAPETRTVVDADGVTIYYYVWAVPNPKAVIHVSHGVGEHARRYAPLARELNAAGYTVAADDHRGHGQTGASHLGVGKLGERPTRAATDAVQVVGERIREENPALPLVLLAHSWGSMMGQKIVNRTPLYDAVVLSGTSLAVLGIVGAGNYNRRWKSPTATGLEWLSRDEAVWAAFTADELNFDIGVTPAWNTVQALVYLGRPPRKMPRDTPMLIQGGSDDPFGGTRGLTLLRNAYVKRAKLSDVTLKIYPGARHEIYNETNRDEIIGDLVQWLDAHAHSGR
ncbi:alpha-beta hydrolase superfamily lysophospholipase [Okibacterium sp. HSC-33S16]|uniref:alpha/beta fold hydrolase n=1 Tax=Okibacterium sp. HSC-33S16 TaxID=2910965 RepID=UPI0020A0110E|nr:alpha/beta hydrolase [Okibacterium sp. HSC-33S16]MCP2032550.1 alpha-beta hydrolase superfamily lysophospholipase [Okibacterium sp. HSC-33S16]